MSLLKVNEVQNYNGSSLTLTASTVSTSAQLNTGGNISVTGSINVSDDSTTRSNLGLGSIATQASDSVSITGGNITGGTIGSSVVFPANTIFYLGTATVTSAGAADSASSGFQDTGLQITISDVSAYSKIIVQASLVFRADPGGSFSLAAYQLKRTAPSVSTFNIHNQIGNPSTTIHIGTVTLLGIDTSLGSGSHTYKVQYLRVLSSNVTYLGPSGSISTLVAYGVV